MHLGGSAPLRGHTQWVSVGARLSAYGYPLNEMLEQRMHGR